jgi:hypothetical protein
MQPKKVLPAMVVVWVWWFVFDSFLLGPTMGSAMAQIPGVTAEHSKLWEVVGELCGSVILVWFYSKVAGVFGTGVMGGLKYGLSAGVLIHFPTWLNMTVYASWPYHATWHATLVLIVATGIAGLLAGLVFEKMGDAAA